ncbi:MAG: hypothetical protein NVS1B6_05260 [Steroidobacteraceae bacterium]
MGAAMTESVSMRAKGRIITKPTTLIATINGITTTIMNAPVASIMTRADTGPARCHELRDRVIVLLLAGTLSLAAVAGAHAADMASAHAAVSRDAKNLGETVKRDAKAVVTTVKEGAHRAALASQAIGHEIAIAVRRSATEARAALRGDKHVDSPAI